MKINYYFLISLEYLHLKVMFRAGPRNTSHITTTYKRSPSINAQNLHITHSTWYLFETSRTGKYTKVIQLRFFYHTSVVTPNTSFVTNDTFYETSRCEEFKWVIYEHIINKAVN